MSESTATTTRGATRAERPAAVGPRRSPARLIVMAVLLVVHDLPTGAMRHLEAFLDTALDEGARFVLDLPDDCVPIRRGEVVGSLEGLVSGVGTRA